MRVAAAGTATSIVRLEGLKASSELLSEEAEARTPTGRLVIASGTLQICALDFLVQTARAPTGVDWSIVINTITSETRQRLRGSDDMQLS